jgi:cbb3-type cytochrome oxidase maturation protein
MSVLYVALPAALLLGGAAMLACVACIRRGQFDDLETPAVRMLIDERPLGEDNPSNVAAIERKTTKSAPLLLRK